MREYKLEQESGTVTTHKCDKETDIAIIREQLKTIFKILNSNGKKGLVENVNDIRFQLVKLSSQFSIKQWIQRGAIAILIALVSWLATLHFG